MGKVIQFKLQTEKNRQVIDLTERVQRHLDDKTSACIIYVAHTTCAITTADLDPGTDLDLLDAAWEMIPKLSYRHPHDPSHVPAHLASSIIGTQTTVPVKNGQLILGTWQRLILVELDGPKSRDIVLALID